MKKPDWIFLGATLGFLCVIGLLLLREQQALPEDGYRVFAQIEAGESTLEIQKVNINTDGAEELTRLKGIGPVLAQRIVEDREENGPYTCPEDLLRVKGIGKNLLNGIRDEITWEMGEE